MEGCGEVDLKICGMNRMMNSNITNMQTTTIQEHMTIMKKIQPNCSTMICDTHKVFMASDLTNWPVDTEMHAGYS